MLDCSDTIFINTLSVLIEESKNKLKKRFMLIHFFPIIFPHLLRRIQIINLFMLVLIVFFQGMRGNYNEMATPDASDNYGKTKSLGEVYQNNTLTLRTSKIGPCLKNQNEELLDWFLKQKGTIKGYKNAIWNGVTTLELAKSIKKAIELKITGIYNLPHLRKYLNMNY